jgi:hypothetical protein
MVNDPESYNTQQPQAGTPVTGEADPDLMIDHLSYEQARDYVLKFLIGEKKTAAALRQNEQDFQKWNERLAFAEQKGMTQQIPEVKRQLHFLIEDKAKLTGELDALRRKIVILKEKLQDKAKNVGIPSSAFAEQLLANLEQVANVDEYKLNEAMKQHEAEEELAKLKAKLGM